jgi:hypothetical protein
VFIADAAWKNSSPDQRQLNLSVVLPHQKPLLVDTEGRFRRRVSFDVFEGLRDDVLPINCRRWRMNFALISRPPKRILFESNRQTRYSTRTVQSIVTTCARTAGIKKRVYPYLLRHSIATILLDSGLVPIDQLEKFLGQPRPFNYADLCRNQSARPRRQLHPGLGRDAVGTYFAEIGPSLG